MAEQFRYTISGWGESTSTSTRCLGSDILYFAEDDECSAFAVACPSVGPPHGISYNVGRWCCMLIEATVIVGVGFVGDRRGGGIWGDGMWGKRMASVQ